MKNFWKMRIIAATAAPPQFVSDTIRLAKDAMGWLIAISAVMAALFAGWFAFEWYRADENEKPRSMKKLKGVGLGAVGVIVAEAVITLVLSYYTH